MNTNRKSNNVARLTRLLDDGRNMSTEYVRYLGKLAETEDPGAARAIARYLDMPGMVGRCAAQSLVRLAQSSSACLEVVLHICEERVERSLDSDEIRNARQVSRALVHRFPMRNAA